MVCVFFGVIAAFVYKIIWNHILIVSVSTQNVNISEWTFFDGHNYKSSWCSVWCASQKMNITDKCIQVETLKLQSTFLCAFNNVAPRTRSIGVDIFDGHWHDTRLRYRVKIRIQAELHDSWYKTLRCMTIQLKENKSTQLMFWMFYSLCQNENISVGKWNLSKKFTSNFYKNLTTGHICPKFSLLLP